MIGLDTSGFLALLDAGEPDHDAAKVAIKEAAGIRWTTDFVLAEVDYVVCKRLGVQAELSFLSQVRQGAVRREPVTDTDLARAQVLIGKYTEHAIGLTDATLVSVAERLGCQRILTLDRNHFRLFRLRSGKPFVLVP